MLLTTTRTSRRCARWIHHFNTAASLFRFTRSDRDELCPPGIQDALGKMVIPYQVLDRQVFELDDTEAHDQLFRFLEMMIPALPGNGLMFLRQPANRFLSSLAALLAARNSPLCRLQ